MRAGWSSKINQLLIGRALSDEFDGKILNPFGVEIDLPFWVFKRLKKLHLLERGGGCRDGQASGFNDLRPNEIARMGRVLQWHGICSSCASGNPLNSHRRFRARRCRYETSDGGCG